MTKNDLIDALSQKNGKSKVEMTETVNEVFDAIIDELSTGEPVNINGFGAWQVRHRAARTGRHPRTGETIQIAATKSVGFKPAKALKDRVKNQ